LVETPFFGEHKLYIFLNTVPRRYVQRSSYYRIQLVVGRSADGLVMLSTAAVHFHGWYYTRQRHPFEQ